MYFRTAHRAYAPWDWTWTELTFREVLSIYRMQNHLEAYATGSIRLKNFIVKVRALLVGRLASACAAKVNA